MAFFAVVGDESGGCWEQGEDPDADPSSNGCWPEDLYCDGATLMFALSTTGLVATLWCVHRRTAIHRHAPTRTNHATRNSLARRARGCAHGCAGVRTDGELRCGSS